MASADPTEPGSFLNDPGPATGTDTEYTPVAKETELWTRLGGAEFREQGQPQLPSEGSPTPLSADLFAVSFRNLFNGFFGGDRCEDRDAEGEELVSCHRVPVIYRYRQDAGRDGQIEEAYSAPGQGYVAAVAWLGADRALAVGGSGEYPRREPAAVDAKGPQDDPTGASVSLPGADPAGQARAWLYANGRWEEITDQLPDGMGALTTLDVAPDSSACGPEATECALVGGLRQIWRWKDGHFTQEFTPTSTDEQGNPTVIHGGEWRFRVRQLRFSPSGAKAAAVTSGCCDLNPANDSGRLLIYNATSGKWNAQPIYAGKAGSVEHHETLPESYYALTFSGLSGEELSVLATPGGPEREAEHASRIVGPLSGGDSRPDPTAWISRLQQNPANGAVSVATDVTAQPTKISSAEQATISSIALAPGQANSDIPHELANPNLSSLRLVAGDGDEDRGPSGLAGGAAVSSGLAAEPAGPDGLMDWAVGQLRSSGQGVAYTTAARAWALDAPLPLSCPSGQAGGVSTDCEPDPDAAEGQARSRALLKLPTYALNAFDLDTEHGVGWAVGDKGAIVRLGGEGTVGSATPPPPPPSLGNPTTTSPPASQPYDGFRDSPAGSGLPGAVPALDAQPLRKLDSPRFLPAGSPDSRPADGARPRNQELVRQIVMSREGGEGWAIGPGKTPGDEQMTLYHYTGERWRRCRLETIPALPVPDPGCASLGPIAKAGVKLTAAARVPLERDNDPTNDDEFEMVAAGTVYKDNSQAGDTTSNVILRYRDGRWAVDWQAKREANIPSGQQVNDIAFVRPDDGWLLASDSAHPIFLHHFDGEHWSLCSPGASACGDAGAIPYDSAYGIAPFHLALAGDRLYLYGAVFLAGGQTGGSNRPHAPLILSKDPGGSWESTDGGYDPASEQGGAGPDQQGELDSLSVVQKSDGSFSGWAVGQSSGQPSGASSVFLRLGSGGQWGQVEEPEPLTEYLPLALRDGPQVVATLDRNGDERTVFDLSSARGRDPKPLFTYESEEGGDGVGWSVLPTPFLPVRRLGGTTSAAPGTLSYEGNVRALTSDSNGGFWIAAEGATVNARSTYFYHWTDRAPEPVFSDVSHPIREPVTAATAGPDGRLWLTTASERLYTYDRITGWDTLRIGGWDAGRIVTRPAHANAVAVGADGSAVVAGENGRIAAIDPAGGVTLDPAPKLLCGAASCSTTEDLRAAAVAPDGSALVGGDRRALAWRSAAGEGFHSVTPPTAALVATITGLSMPSSDRAWLSTDTGDIFRGERAGPDWAWSLENITPDGDPLTRTLDNKRTLPLNAISIDADGHGYAVGDQGVILEREPDGGATPWRRLDDGYLDDFDSLYYRPGGVTLIGGESGLILTRQGNSFETARPADYFDPFSTAFNETFASKTVAVTAAPGPDGATEAWAISQASSVGRNPAPAQVLHYSSDPSDPLLDGGSDRAGPLPDSPAPRADELTLAAFGKSDCQIPTNRQTTCPEHTGSNLANEVVLERVRDEILSRARRPDGPQLAFFTGDVDQFAGSGGEKVRTHPPVEPSVVHQRWVELTSRPFAQARVPLFGAIGGEDVSHTEACPQNPVPRGCTSTHETKTGSNLGWREALAGMPAPWGVSGGQVDSRQGLSFEEVETAGPRVESGDITVEDPTEDIEDPTVEDPTGQLGDQTIAAPHPGDRTVPTGGAHTHYAFDVVRDGRRIARVAVLDSSLRSLAASDPLQNPLEATGQLKWLADVLCRAPAQNVGGEPCTRRPDQRAIVVSNTPTYSYGPGALSDTQTDGTALESVLLANDVDLVISGRLGWNGVYWVVAPGLHYPCPGGAYHDPNDRENPPPAVPDCNQATPSEAEEAASEAQKAVGEAVSGGGGGDAVAVVVASSAGGKFGADGQAQGSAADGFWRGYSLIHLDPETGEVSIEQRPVFDWVGIQSKPGTQGTHALRAGKQLELEGFGREPVGMERPARYDEISSAAITHRFDLLVADPSEPWLPQQGTREDDCDPYDCLDSSIGTIDAQSGDVRAGKGQYPRTYAIAQLSAGEQQATYPLAFEPRASFRLAPPPPPPPVAVAPPPPPPAPAQPTTPSVNLPAAPVLPILTAQALAPPPVPPTPPTFASEAPLDLNLAPSSIDATPPTAVTQPPTPPVNPAPPSGARREARQRQAAAQKSGADSAEEGSGETADPGEAQVRSDPVDAPNQSATRLDGGSARHPFTAVADRGQPSAWARDLQWASGLVLIAIVLAAGWLTARPTPRRRDPPVPAPALARRRGR